MRTHLRPLERRAGFDVVESQQVGSARADFGGWFGCDLAVREARKSGPRQRCSEMFSTHNFLIVLLIALCLLAWTPRVAACEFFRLERHPARALTSLPVGAGNMWAALPPCLELLLTLAQPQLRFPRRNRSSTWRHRRRPLRACVPPYPLSHSSLKLVKSSRRAAAPASAFSASVEANSVVWTSSGAEYFLDVLQTLKQL